jgi:DTW domain-containing protein YfiP
MAPDLGHERCERCLFQRRLCLCGEIPSLPTRTRIVIVRHHTERWRSSNSGRLAHLALPNSAVVDHGGEGGIAVLPPLDGAWLLYPEGEPLHAPPPEPPRQLVVLDATWSQARRMYRKLAALRGLPVLRLPDAPMPAARLRESPAPGRVSTIEAIARALRLLEGDQGDAAAGALEGIFALAVARAAASGRNVGGAGLRSSSGSD